MAWNFVPEVLWLFLCLHIVHSAYRRPDPLIDETGVNVTVRTGDTATLPCSATYLWKNKVVWFDQNSTLLTKGVTVVINDPRLSILRYPGFDENWHLIMKNTTSADSGKYICGLDSAAVNKTRTVYLTVIDGYRGNQYSYEPFPDAMPRPERSEVNVTVNIGETAELPCYVPHPGPYQVVWKDDIGFDLCFHTIPSKRFPRVSCGRPAIWEWNMKIPNVTFEDRGPYYCDIFRHPRHTLVVNLIVLDPMTNSASTATVSRPLPVLEDTPVNVTVYEGDTALLPCSVDHLGEYKVFWTKYPLVLTVNKRLYATTKRTKIKHPSVRDWHLMRKKVRPLIAGNYFCKINTNPVQSKLVNLIILDKRDRPKAPPPIPDTVTGEWIPVDIPHINREELISLRTNFPLRTWQDLDLLEERLTNSTFYKQLVYHIYTLQNPMDQGSYRRRSRRIRLVLCYLLDNDLVTQLSWRGRGNKRALHSLQLKGVVTKAVKTQEVCKAAPDGRGLICKELPEEEVELSLRRWFQRKSSCGS